MKVTLLTISHRQPAWVVQGCAEYERRLPREWAFRVVEVKPAPRSGNVAIERVQAAEAERLRAALPKTCRTIALDERGEACTTERLAARFRAWQQEGRDLAFIIGGADGMDPELLAGSDSRLSLSPLTLPHGLVRIVVAEQLYRVASVLSGHPYHRA